MKRSLPAVSLLVFILSLLRKKRNQRSLQQDFKSQRLQNGLPHLLSTPSLQCFHRFVNLALRTPRHRESNRLHVANTSRSGNISKNRLALPKGSIWTSFGYSSAHKNGSAINTEPLVNPHLLTLKLLASPWRRTLSLVHAVGEGG